MFVLFALLLLLITNHLIAEWCTELQFPTVVSGMYCFSFALRSRNNQYYSVLQFVYYLPPIADELVLYFITVY